MTLVGRNEERMRIDAALDACMRGEFAVVLVEGAAGCGKSALLQYCADAARRRGAVTVHAAHPAQPAGSSVVDAAYPVQPAGWSAVDAAFAVPSAGWSVVDAVYPVQPAGWSVVDAVFAVASGGSSVGEAAVGGGVARVVCVDDAGRADVAGQARLGALVSAAPGGRGGLLLVVAVDPAEPFDAVLEGVLLGHPALVRVRVGPLPRPAIGQWLRAHAGVPVCDAVVGRVHDVSGGNPVLVRALLGEPGHDPQPGGPFARAVNAFLERCPAPAAAVARALAVLGEQASTERAARVLRTAPADVAPALSALAAVGLTRGHRLRHPLARTAALQALAPGGRRALHRRAARVLHETQAPACAVADLLCTAGGADEDWAVQALRDAARQAMTRGEDERAAVCLHLAHTACVRRGDTGACSDIALQLAALTWKTSPQAAEHHLAGPLAELRAERLTPAAAARLARLLTAQGRLEEAAEALRRASGSAVLHELLALPPADRTPAPSGRVSAPSGGRVSVLSDGRASAPSGGRVPVGGDRGGAPAGGVFLRACGALWTHPGRRHEDDLRDAERFLATAPPAPGTHDALAQALRTLLHAGRPHRAQAWARRLCAQSPRHRASGRHAVYGALQGEALLHLGDLAGAEAAAGAAVDALTGRGGRFGAAPAAVLVMALTARGRYEDAARHLQPLDPDAIAHTVHVLPLLRARGHYLLATHRADAALDAFRESGRLAARWGLDRPCQHPWRTDAAEALLRTGHRREARTLITEQLALPACTGPRPDGVALRLRAATEPPGERARTLARSVAELRACGDRLELAKALADLGRALQTAGEGARAGALVRRAWNLAADCAASPLCQDILPGHDPGAPPGERTALDEARTGRLSAAQRRIAALAAAGYTNREIAARLFITASTVEQHLTRVYRTLQVSRRRDLPLDLDADATAPAPPPTVLPSPALT